MRSTDQLPDEQLLMPARAAVRAWLIPFASHTVVIAPQQNCARWAAT
jgi:hypothetical protein